MHFNNQNSIHAEPNLKLYGAPIPVVTETKFLGLVLLTFAAHIKYLDDRCLKALNLLRVEAHKDWVPTVQHYSRSIDRTSDQSWILAVLCTGLHDHRLGES